MARVVRAALVDGERVRIAQVDVLADPARLRQLDVAVLPD
jgi:hypothetical protein